MRNKLITICNADDKPQRFYYESDGDPGRRTHYVVDHYADPMSDQGRTDCSSKAEAQRVSREFNVNPPWPIWDLIQQQSDKEKYDV